LKAQLVNLKVIVMKKIFLLFTLSILVFSCKNSEEKTEDPNASGIEETNVDLLQSKMYKGEFIYMADAAVLKGDTYIFGVKMDDMAAKLGERVAPIKKDEFDMVPVIVKGTVTHKAQDQEGWDQILTITEILEVSPEPAKADVKIGEKKS
jgi:hypothetical protein